MLEKLARDLPEVCEGARGQGLLWGLMLRRGFVARDLLPLIQEGGVLLIAAGEHVLRFAPPLVVSRAQLEERIYGWGEEVASNSVEVHIHNLRKKLGDATIRTVRGVGYAIANDSDAPCRSAENSS